MPDSGPLSHRAIVTSTANSLALANGLCGQGALRLTSPAGSARSNNQPGPAMPQHCFNCRFWSEMAVRSVEAGPMEALCLGPGMYRNKYVRADHSCADWRTGHLGALDSPFGNNAFRQAAYEAEGR